MQMASRALLDKRGHIREWVVETPRLSGYLGVLVGHELLCLDQLLLLSGQL